jgi:hypothetical protein
MDERVFCQASSSLLCECPSEAIMILARPKMQVARFITTHCIFNLGNDDKAWDLVTLFSNRPYF